MGDISKKTLVVLFIVAIVLSAVATWKILSTPTTVVVKDKAAEQGKAQVSFGIGGEPVPAEPVVKTGQVNFVVQ